MRLPPFDHGFGTLDREQWERFVSRWSQAESRFDRDPAEAVREAGRLFLDLTGQPDFSPASIIRYITHVGQPANGRRRSTFAVEGDLFSALPDLVRAVSASYRHGRQAQAAQRGIRAARVHGTATVSDFQAAMQLYRSMFQRVLGVKRDDLAPVMSGIEMVAKHEANPGGSSMLDDPAAQARERVIAQRIVNESMRVVDEQEARSDRGRSVRWGVLQLVANIAIGLAILLILIWVLSQQ